MDKIKKLLKQLQGDPERCAKCAEDMDYDCPYAGDPNGCNSPTYRRFYVPTLEIADELEEEFKKIGEKLRQQEWMIKKFMGYAAVTLKAGFFNADHLKQLVSEAKEVLNEQD